MRYCKRCVYPQTKPGITFDKDGVCSGCRAQERKKDICWDSRLNELRDLADRYKNDDGQYDCVIPISGGKDSHAQVHLATSKLGLTPLCVSVVPQAPTEIGVSNLKNLQSRFGVDLLMFRPNPDVAVRLTRYGMLKNAWPNWAQDKLIYSWPLRQALQHGIPLVFMGENHDFEKGGKDLGQGANAAEQMKHSLEGEVDLKKFRSAGFSDMELAAYFNPERSWSANQDFDVRWLGYYFDWDSHSIFELAQELGFKSLDEPYQGTLDTYSGIDDAVVAVNGWLKFIKFGFGWVTDSIFNHISYGRMSRDDGVRLVNDLEGLLDPRCKQAWLDYACMDEREFDNVVARFANKDVVMFESGQWRLREPVH